MSAAVSTKGVKRARWAPVGVPGQAEPPGRGRWIDGDHGHVRVVLVHREQRQHRVGQPAGDATLDRGVVVGAEDVVRLVGEAAEAVVDGQLATGVAEPDHREAGDLLDAHRSAGGLRGVGRGHEHHRVVEQPSGLEGEVVVHRQLDERDVEVARLDLAQQVVAVVGLVERQLDARPLGPEGPQEAGEDLRADALDRPDPQLAPVAGLERPQVGGGGVDPGQHGSGVDEQRVARRGELDRPGAAGPVEQRRSHDALERGDLLADRGLGVPQPLGGPAERARLGHRHQGHEVAQLDRRPGKLERGTGLGDRCSSSSHDGHQS